jgi:Alternative complex III, ActD subunit
VAESLTLLAVFPDVGPASDGIERLREMGVPDDRMNVISGIPFPGRVLGRPSARTNVAQIGLAGAGLGALFGLFLIYGIPLLYPLYVGGQPLFPIPMGFIAVFEMTMLGLMGFSFLGLFVDSGFPSYTPKEYVTEISNGKIAILFSGERKDEQRYVDSLTKLGAESVKPAEARQL